ncbi:MAG: tyrosine-type recombinase/integrase [Ignavibacteria bacterium]|jgi:integrase/recombinase XerD|nr:tyrosine-type recombinase/integrase [Ignavibacteria bacterium]
MASVYVKRKTLHIGYKKDGEHIVENLNLEPTDENWEKAQDIKKQIEVVYETKNENSFVKKLLQKELEVTELSLYKAIEKYQKYLSNGSVKHQSMFVYAMNNFVKIVDPGRQIHKIGSEDIVDFLKLLKTKNLSNSTQRTYYTYVKLFFNYLMNEDLLVKSPCRNVKAPAEIEKEVVTFNDEMLFSILELAKLRDIKLYQLFIFLLLTGMRPVDALNIKKSDFVMEEEYIKLQISKTKNYRQFPIYPELKDFCNEELGELVNESSNDRLFQGFTVGSVGQRFRRIKKRLGIPNNYTITLKTFRKTLATRMQNKGVRLEFVSHLLGHKKIQTTKKYYTSMGLNAVQNEIVNSSGDILQQKPS